MNSSLAVLETDVSKFFHNTGTDLERFGKAFVGIFGKVPSALQTVENFVGEAAPVITGVVAIADPIAEPEVAAALATAETGLAAIQAAATAANSGTSLLQNLQNFSTAVPSTLSGLDIKNPALKAKVTGFVTFVVSESKVLIPAVESWVAQLAAKATPAAA